MPRQQLARSPGWLGYRTTPCSSGSVHLREASDQQIDLGLRPEGTLVETKTAASAATIPLPVFVIERLRAHIAHLDAERRTSPGATVTRRSSRSKTLGTGDLVLRLTTPI